MKIRKILQVNVFIAIAVIVISLVSTIFIRSKIDELHLALTQIEDTQLELGRLSDISMKYMVFEKEDAIEKWNAI
ncbi:MAG: hypothetical protein JXR56_03025 [Candidatus Cloacimonetes bacterium]|nr:hypothetical protein [Candidatus Cloacimonadota bacterium]